MLNSYSYKTTMFKLFSRWTFSTTRTSFLMQCFRWWLWWRWEMVLKGGGGRSRRPSWGGVFFCSFIQVHFKILVVFKIITHLLVQIKDIPVLVTVQKSTLKKWFLHASAHITYPFIDHLYLWVLYQVVYLKTAWEEDSTRRMTVYLLQLLFIPEACLVI